MKGVLGLGGSDEEEVRDEGRTSSDDITNHRVKHLGGRYLKLEPRRR